MSTSLGRFRRMRLSSGPKLVLAFRGGPQPGHRPPTGAIILLATILLATAAPVSSLAAAPKRADAAVNAGAWQFNTAGSKPGPKPRWHVSATAAPVPRLPPNPEVAINDLACPSAGNCVAIGSYLGTSNSKRALIESERAGRWTARPAPTPAGVAAVGASELDAVACTSTGSCIAVGYYVDRAHRYQGLIVSESKGAWSASMAPLPKGMSSLVSKGAFLTTPAGLLQVACPQTGGCVATGSGALPSGGVAIVLVQSKGRWSASLAARPFSDAETLLTGLACSQPGSCVITGTRLGNASHPFILSLSNGTWSKRDAPVPVAAITGSPDLEVGPVACPAHGSCIAIGNYASATDVGKGFLLTGSGTTWTAIPAPLPPGDAKANTDLGSIACTRAGTCTAVGDIVLTEAGGKWRAVPAPALPGSPAKYVDESKSTGYASTVHLACNAAGCTALALNLALDNDPAVLLSERSGGPWQARAVPVPHPAGARRPAGAGAVSGAAVACPATSACTAAATYYDASANVQGMLIAHTAAGWSATIAPLPRDAGYDLAVVQLRSVTCAAEGLCTAIGELDNDGMVVGPLAESLRKGAWRATLIRLPADAAQSQLQTAVPSKLVAGQVCPAASSCVGVGDYENSAGEDQELVLGGAGQSWHAARAPLPTGAGTTDQELWTQAVTCPSAGSCTVVGTYIDSRGNVETFALTGSNGAWRATAVPLPPQVTTLGDDVGYTSVACPAAGSCTAVGSYTGRNGAATALIVSESAGRWATISAPLPSGTVIGKDTMSELDGLACPHEGSCYAVGSYWPTGDWDQPLLETETGSSWRAVEPPQPAGAVPGAELNAIACPSSCVATGDYDNGGDPSQEAYILSGSGARWSAHAVPLPGARGADELSLGALSCPTAGSCVAAGWYSRNNNDSEGVWLAESVAAAAQKPTWVALPAPPPAGSGVTSLGRDGTITSVSCPLAGWCVALGAFDNSAGAATALFEALTSG